MLARAAGKNIPAEVEMIFGETDESNPFVPVEQMMPFVPFVRCRDVDEAIEMARAQRARLPPHGDHPLEQRPQHDQDGQGRWTPRCSSRTARAWPGWASAAKDTARSRSPARPAKA